MTEQQYPLTPSPELVHQWIDNDDFPFATGTFDLVSITKDRLRSIATQAANWGANQELDACVKWLIENHYTETPVNLLRARRAKPPSLAEQALEALQDQIDRSFKVTPEAQERADLIRRALERLQELENG